MQRMMQAAKHLQYPRLHRANVMGLDLGGMHLPKLSLLGEGPPAHLQDHLEALATPSGVLLEALNSKLLDTVLDLLPTTAERNDLSILLEGCFGVGCGCGGLVDNGLAHRQQIGPSHVDAGHGDLLALGINVRRLVDMRHLLAAEERAGRDPVQYYAQVHKYFAELPPERFPTTTALASKLATGDGDDRFRFGLDLLVGGLAAMADAQR